MTTTTEMLNLSDDPSCFPITGLNGPGLRYALFVQGCPLLCTKYCFNPDNLSMEDRVLVSVEDLLAHIQDVQASYGIEGVTLLGGEPFGQAVALARFAEGVHNLGLTVVTYTGYQWEKLLNHPEAGWSGLLAETDILVEGPFWAHEFSPNLLWRGSRNQRIVFLSDRYTPPELLQQCITWVETSHSEVLKESENASQFTKKHIQLPPPELQVFDNYYGRTELHWSYLNPLEIWNENGGQNRRTTVRPNTGSIWWWPEREYMNNHIGFVRKGLILIVGLDDTLLYGFQGGDDWDRFRNMLEPLGIQLESTSVSIQPV